MSERKCKIIVQQPALPKYRIPFFSEWTKRDGVELKVFYSDEGTDLENELAEGFQAECIPMWSRRVGRRKIMWHPAQWKGARRGVCDVLVLTWDVQYLSLVPALLRARLNGIHTILWGHGYSKNESSFRKCLRDIVGRMADALVFYDFNTARQFVEAGWPSDRIHSAPNALDQDEIQATRSAWLNQPERLKLFQQQNGLAGRKNIIYIGRIYSENRLDILLNALPEVKAKHSTFQLIVIGKVNETAKELQRLAAHLDVEDSIIWLGALYDEDQIAPYMLSSKLFCYPANIGLSIMHAMGYGIPVVTGDHIPSHNPEIHALKDGENGCLFAEGDAKDLARRISWLLDNEEQRAAMASNARNAVLESFTIDRMVDGFMSAVTGCRQV